MYQQAFLSSYIRRSGIHPTPFFLFFNLYFFTTFRNTPVCYAIFLGDKEAYCYFFSWLSRYYNSFVCSGTECLLFLYHSYYSILRTHCRSYSYSITLVAEQGDESPIFYIFLRVQCCTLNLSSHWLCKG